MSNFWGAVQFETDSLIILATYTFAVYIVEVGLTIIYFRCSYLENLDNIGIHKFKTCLKNSNTREVQYRNI